jgi:hypothetical protein
MQTDPCQLEYRIVDTDAVLYIHGIARESLQDSNLFISANIIHRFLEDAASVAKDPFLSVHVGEQLDFSAWSPLVDAVARATTLADFMTRFILAASEDASSGFLS